MKKITAALACLVLLTGCGSSEPESAPITTVPATSETTSATSAPENDFGQLEYSVDLGGIDITINGGLFQRIELDCTGLLAYTEKINSAPETILVHRDYDMDGLDDLFVPTEYRENDRIGTYFRYEPGADEYVPWDELNKYHAEFTVETERGGVSYSDITGPYTWETFFFRWENGELVKTGRHQQRPTDTDVLLRYEYEISGETERLIKKTQITLDEQHKYILETTELPIEEES